MLAQDKNPRMDTPLMLQYQELKGRHPQELLFFRLGDFYELFAEDAKRACATLEVALTHRQQIPMCGVPAHAIDAYIGKVLKAGFRVAIADQMEEASPGKGLVRRNVVRVITPGTLQEDSLLPARRCNFLAALAPTGDVVGLAAIECSTGEFLVTEMPNTPALWDEVARIAPSEVILGEGADASFKQQLLRMNIACVDATASDFSMTLAQERLKAVFQIASIRGLGLDQHPAALAAAGAAVRYLEHTQCGKPISLRLPHYYSQEDHLLIDVHTLQHLELIETASSPRSRSLLSVIDATLTAMGGRLLRRWLVAPLRRLALIQERQEAVAFFLDNRESRRHLRTELQGFPDLERILTRIRAQSASPRDLASLGLGLNRLATLHGQLAAAYQTANALGTSLSASLSERLQHFPLAPEMAGLLSQAIIDAPPATMKDGGVIRDGYDSELDEVRTWIHDGKTRLLELEKREKERTGIPNLKVGFNSVFGYFLEITKSYAARVPADYIRKQTTANGERYITPELKEYETKILGSEERAIRLETALLRKVCETILASAPTLLKIASAISELDVFLGLAEKAEQGRYVKPEVDESTVLSIRDGRHPVLDDVLPMGTLVANDLELDGGKRQIIILTGPNMSGKSTYLRQSALIVVLAQMGSFVPAASAHIGIVDRLFTRIGASDRLADGESTFMVEMVETANILNHATERSLVILDEVGRGTSTYDGISIAWACLEFLNGTAPTGTASRGPKVLFATHYFELTKLAGELPGVCNAHVTAREWGDQVIFLHKVEEGPADRAYGIHVAKLAGIPKSVVDRARNLLQQLEYNAQKAAPQDAQPLLFSMAPAPVIQKNVPDETLAALKKDLEDLTINDITPLDALTTLNAWKARLTKSKRITS